MRNLIWHGCFQKTITWVAGQPSRVTGEGDGAEGASTSALLCLPDRLGGIRLHVSEPMSWCLPSGPGILTLRDQLVADEQEHFRQSLANKPHLRAPGAGHS